MNEKKKNLWHTTHWACGLIVVFDYIFCLFHQTSIQFAEAQQEQTMYIYIYVENWLDIYVSSSKRTQIYPIQAWNIFFFLLSEGKWDVQQRRDEEKKTHSHHIHFSLFFRLLQEMKSGSLFVHIKSGPCRRNLFFFIQLNSFYVVMAFSREVFSINTNTFHHFMILSQGSFIAFIIQWTLLSVR